MRIFGLPAILPDIFLFLVAAFLRVYCLGAESAWVDETGTVTIARLPFSLITGYVMNYDVHPPLIYLLLNPVIQIFGESEWVIRMPSVIAGSLAVPLFYRLVSRMVDRETAFFSAILFAVSNFHISYAQEARQYALLVFLSIVSMRLYLATWDCESRLNQVMWGGSIIAGLFLHHFGFLTWVIQGVHSMWCRFKDGSSRGFSRIVETHVLIAGMAGIFWLPILIEQMRITFNLSWIPRPGLAELGGCLITFAGGVSDIERGLALGSRHHAPALGLLAFFAIGCWWFFRVSESESAVHGGNQVVAGCLQYRGLVAAWFIVPVFVPFVFSQFGTPVFLARTSIVGSLPLFIFGGYLIAAMRCRRFQVLVIAVAVLLSLASWGQSLTTVRKTEWRQAVGYFEASAKSGDLLLFEAFFVNTALDYHCRRNDVERVRFPVDQPTIETCRARVAEMVGKRDRVWMLTAHSMDPKGLTLQVLRGLFPKEAERREFFGITLRLFARGNS